MYAERLTVPLRWWVQATMLVASFWIAMLVAFPEGLAWAASLIGLAVQAAVMAAMAAYGSARVAVTDYGSLVAGRAEIGLEHLGDAEVLEAERTRLVAGREADARAYLLLRPYLRRSLRVRVTDPADPTPYWLISCRHPERVLDALSSRGGGSASTASE